METDQEWNFINSKIQTRDEGDNEWWIGLRKNGQRWLWENGKRLSIDKWQTTVGEPNGDGDCAAMAKSYPKGTKGLFKDMRCDIRKMFICEYNERKSSSLLVSRVGQVEPQLLVH